LLYTNYIIQNTETMRVTQMMRTVVSSELDQCTKSWAIPI